MSDHQASKNRLVIGPGFVGGRMVLKWIEQGDRVFSFSRSPEKQEILKQAGVVVLGDSFSKMEAYQGIPPIDSVLISLSYDRSQGSSYQSVMNLAFEALKTLTGSNPDLLRDSSIFFTSSTGVYRSSKDGGCEEIDENGAIGPSRPSAITSYEMEGKLRQLFGNRLTILRLAGIYHPKRVPGKQAIENRVSLKGDPEGFINLIHVDDICSVIQKMADSDSRPALVNVSDGVPRKRKQFYQAVSDILDLPNPEFEQVGDAVSGSGRIGSGKLVGNSRLKQWLGADFQFQSLRQGLTTGTDGLI